MFSSDGEALIPGAAKQQANNPGNINTPSKKLAKK